MGSNRLDVLFLADCFRDDRRFSWGCRDGLALQPPERFTAVFLNGLNGLHQITLAGALAGVELILERGEHILGLRQIVVVPFQFYPAIPGGGLNFQFLLE